MKWGFLTELAQVQEIKNKSEERPILIYKHSIRCSTSQLVLNRLERNWGERQENLITPFFLDLISHRMISEAISHIFEVSHESPQVLVIHKGKSIYDESHFAIDFK